MAIYEYFCSNCQKVFELMRPISETHKSAKCPKCGLKAQKLFPGSASKTGDSIQPAGKPFRKGVAVMASKGKGKTKKISKRRSKQ